jgi:hypothetical protein
MNRAGQRTNPDVSRLMDQLAAKRVVRPGMEFQCGSCGRNAWYHVSEFAERFVCKWCFTEQTCPRVDARQWRYRADGLFALEGKMAGCSTVLLTAVFP